MGRQTPRRSGAVANLIRWLRQGSIPTSTLLSSALPTPGSSSRVLTADWYVRVEALLISRHSARHIAGSAEPVWRFASSCCPECHLSCFVLNKGLSTLPFQSLSVAADNPKHLQGGTQDNGTWETYGSAVVWPQIIYGDGGQSGFSPNNSNLRFNSFTGKANDVNFQNGDPSKWVIASGPIFSSSEG